MKYLLDTNICVFALRNRPRAVADHIRQTADEDIAVSTVTDAELRHGADKSDQPDVNHDKINKLLMPFEILAFDSGAADAYGEIRAALERQGKPIGPFDMLLAAHAVSKGLIFVTHNTSEFQRVKGLQLEDWFA